MNRQFLTSKKSRGRPIGSTTTGIGTPVIVRLHPPLLDDLDSWRDAQDDKPTRPEALRRLAEKGLKGKR